MDAKVIISWCGVGVAVCFYSCGPTKCSLGKQNKTNKTAHKECTPSSGHCLKFPRNQKGLPSVSPPQDWTQSGGGEGHQQISTRRNLPTCMHWEGSGATSDPTEGSPSQSRRTLSQFGSAGSEESSNELKHYKPNLMEKDHPGWTCHAGRVVLTR